MSALPWQPGLTPASCVSHRRDNEPSKSQPSNWESDEAGGGEASGGRDGLVLGSGRGAGSQGFGESRAGAGAGERGPAVCHPDIGLSWSWRGVGTMGGHPTRALGRAHVFLGGQAAMRRHRSPGLASGLPAPVCTPFCPECDFSLA